MAKGKAGPVKSAPASAPGRSFGSLRRASLDEDAFPPAKKPLARAAAMRLAAEVDRLEAELAATRAQVTALEAKADVDPLLDILNRRGFERELRRSLAYVRRYGTAAALIYLDLDRFKPVNDQHGHAAGDRVLQAVVATLYQTVRESDVVGRLGGDEFGVLLWNVNEIQAAAKAADLESAVARATVTYGAARLSVGASAGFTMLLPPDAPAEVIARADLAMYARKRVRQKSSLGSLGR
jgi:diguanylate cyclase (GGDEF)-like protein